MKKTKLINIAAITIIVVLLIFAAGYFSTVNRGTADSAAVTDPGAASQTAADENPFFSQIFATQVPDGNGGASIGVGHITLRLFLAVILSAILAFRPRKNIRLFERNFYVAQTQILLAVVAAALMMIVGDNAARAFAIFAAVSLVRFRTNIKDPKEVTVLLVCLALGLGAGVGRWDLGLVLCLFVLALLWLLERNEPLQAFRPMELTINTRNTDSTQKALKKIFDRYKLETEVRQFDPPDAENPVGCIVYYLNMRLTLSTDYLSERIIELDEENIESIEWEQKKSASNIYQ